MTKEIAQDNGAAEDMGLFQVLILVLSVFVLVAIMAQTFFTLPPEVNILLNRLDTLICVVFLADFFFRFFRTGDKADFLRWGWIDLVSSIPAVEALRWGRIVRIVRLLRAFRSVKVFLACLYRRRSRAAFSTAGASAFLVAIFSSIAILTFENVPGSNITTAGDSLWWAFYTMANIDYAGHYPVTPEGKAIRFLLVITGMVLFGVFTGYAASTFMEDSEKKRITDTSTLTG